MPIPQGESVFRLLDAETMGRRIREAREKAEVTLTSAAELADLHLTQLSRIERGRQRFFGSSTRAKVEKLASTFLSPGILQFEPADWRGQRASRRKGRKAAPAVDDTFAATEPAPTRTFGMDKFGLLSSLVDAHRQGALTADQTHALMAKVLG